MDKEYRKNKKKGEEDMAIAKTNNKNKFLKPSPDKVLKAIKKCNKKHKKALSLLAK